MVKCPQNNFNRAISYPSDYSTLQYIFENSAQFPVNCYCAVRWCTADQARTSRFCWSLCFSRSFLLPACLPVCLFVCLAVRSAGPQQWGALTEAGGGGIQPADNTL